MRTEKDIHDRIRFLLVQELDARVQLASTRLPRSCVHNYLHPLDVRKTVGGQPNEGYNRITKSAGLPVVQTIGLCMLLGQDGKPVSSPSPDEWGGTICEDPVDAKRCPYFTPVSTKETLLVEFSSQLKDPEWLKTNMPEVYGLLWAMGSRHVPKLPFWKKVLYLFLRINVEPLTPVEDPGKLLEM